MDLKFFSTGMTIGFFIAAPVGPIGLLCIRRTINEGMTAGLITGLGVATADAIYGIIAGFGLTFIAQILISYQSLFRLMGGLFLCYLAVKIFLEKPAKSSDQPSKKGLINNYISTFFLTITNPITILAFTGIFAGLGIVNNRPNYLNATILVSGVFSGSLLWWVLLSGSISLFRNKINPLTLNLINKISAMVIGGFGVMALGSLAQ